VNVGSFFVCVCVHKDCERLFLHTFALGRNFLSSGSHKGEDINPSYSVINGFSEFICVAMERLEVCGHARSHETDFLQQLHYFATDLVKSQNYHVCNQWNPSFSLSKSFYAAVELQ